jgi:hypothetical protein
MSCLSDFLTILEPAGCGAGTFACSAETHLDSFPRWNNVLAGVPTRHAGVGTPQLHSKHTPNLGLCEVRTTNFNTDKGGNPTLPRSPYEVR